MFGFAPSTWKWSQEKISTLFYHHGLFCASHPFGVMTLVISIVLFTCYPLTRLPLPGNAPLQFTTPIEGYKIPPRIPPNAAEGSSSQGEEHRLPRWYLGPPVAYVQQIVVKATVSPWQQRQLIPTDAFRGPLKTVFAVLDDINNFQFGDREHSVSVADYCLHVSETTMKKMPQGMLPEYGCLIVSPAYFWNKDVNKFSSDGEIISTIYRDLRPPLSTPPSLRDILFGIVWKETGVKRFYLRSRQRVISFAVTIIFKKYQQKFTTALRDKLQVAYPLSLTFNNSEVDHLVHVHFRAINHFVEYTPLMVSYVLLFLYIYFSVRKIEMVKSKWGLAFSAVVTVIASLLMSVSLCLSFGLTPSLNGSEIFPYLVVIIGLENVLVMTKSIVSTPIQLDVKLRVAQGLSKEGWHIFKNLMAELLILTVGFFTFVPAVQEFCLFAVVGLLSDFFLQILFFTTVLSIDIRRMELSDLQRQRVIHSSSSEVTMTTTTAPASGLMSCPILTCLMTESAQHAPQAKVPNLHQTQHLVASHTTSYYQLPTPPPSPTDLGRGDGRWDQPYVLKLPRRVRLWNFWARTRVAQRGIMACVIIWIALIVYKTGLVDHLTGTNATLLDDLGGSTSNSNPSIKPFEKFSRPQDWMERKSEDKQQTSVDEKEAAKHGNLLVAHHDMESWRHLSHTHWPKLLGFYNISLRGRYITILPSIHLSKVVSPDSALSERHPLEAKSAVLFSKYSSVDTASDKQRLSQAPNQSQSFLAIMRHRLTVYPRTNTEFILTLILGFASMILLTYALMMLYKCMCPRDYARWRSSWGYVRRRRKRNSLYFNQIQDAVPLILAGHTQEVECIACDGPLIISSCLGSQLRVWDSSTGECRTVINRKTVVPPPPLSERNPVPGRNTDDSDADLYAEYHEHIMETSSIERQMLLHPSDNIPPVPHQQCHSSSESDEFTFSDIAPDLSSSISTNFSELNSLLGSLGHEDEHKQCTESGYDFASRFEPYYKEHRNTATEKAVYYEQKQREQTETAGTTRRFTSEGYEDEVFHSERNRSSGYVHSGSSDEGMPSVSATETTAAAIWCLACQDSLIVAGCGNGRIEFWDGLTGHLKYLYQEGKAGVTAVCFVANRVIAARLNGHIDFLELETFQNVNAPMTQTSVSRLYNRAGHFCRLSSGHVTESHDLRTWDEIIHVTLLSTTHAHQQPINLLLTEGGRVVSGGQDHTLKVYRLEDSLCLYTLHGHSGAITALHLDVMTPLAAASGAEDGTVRLWDLLTGACVHKLGNGHNGRVTALTCTLTHVVSAGLDNRLCIWERWNGHLLHWLHMSPGSCNSLSILPNNLLVSGGQGCLFLWDITKGKVLRVVPLCEANCSVFIHQLCIVRNTAVVCDFGELLQVVHFPTVLQKLE